MKLFHKIYPNEYSKETVFILHGLFGMLDNWHNMAKRLSEKYSVVTVDQRNHGKSPHSDEMSFELMAEDLASLMDHLHISKAHIIGHSMGGKTVMRFADIYPEKLDKVIIVDIAPRKYSPGHLAYFKAFHDIDFSVCQSRKDADDALSKIEKSIGVRQFLLKNLEKDVVGYRLKFNLESIEKFYPQMIGALEFSWIITAPTLFLYGKKSGYISESDIVNIEEVFTESEFVGVDDAGHWVHAEKPAAFLESVLNFLQ